MSYSCVYVHICTKQGSISQTSLFSPTALCHFWKPGEEQRPLLDPLHCSDSSYVLPLFARWTNFSKQVAWVTHHSREGKHHLVPKSSESLSWLLKHSSFVATSGITYWSQISIPDNVLWKRDQDDPMRNCISVFTLSICAFYGFNFLNVDFPNSCFVLL